MFFLSERRGIVIVISFRFRALSLSFFFEHSCLPIEGDGDDGHDGFARRLDKRKVSEGDFNDLYVNSRVRDPSLNPQCHEQFGWKRSPWSHSSLQSLSASSYSWFSRQTHSSAWDSTSVFPFKGIRYWCFRLCAFLPLERKRVFILSCWLLK